MTATVAAAIAYPPGPGGPVRATLPGVPTPVEGGHTGSARFSPCGRYRYELTRTWGCETGPVATFVLLNPSTGDACRLDPTLRRCRAFAFAWRSTDPRELRRAADPVGPGAVASSPATAGSDLREELGRANATALGLLAGVATIAGVGLAALLAGDWTPAELPATAEAVWWAGVTICAAAMGCLVAATLPCLPSDEPGPPVHWGAIAAARSDGALFAGFVELAVEPLMPRVRHVRRMGGIARRKWRRVRRGVQALAASGALLAGAAFTGIT